MHAVKVSVGASAGRPPGEVRRALLGALREHGPLPMRDLAQHTQVGYRAARWTLARCVQAGVVVKAGAEKRAHSRKLVALYDLPDEEAGMGPSSAGCDFGPLQAVFGGAAPLVAARSQKAASGPPVACNGQDMQTGSPGDVMARIELVRDRLENWARWCQQQADGGLGYPKQVPFAVLSGHGRRSEAVIPILSIEAAETDQAVRSLRESQPHLHKMLVLYYAMGLPRHLVASRMGQAESTIKRQLEDADHAIARWLQERHRQQQAMRDAMEAMRTVGARCLVG